MKILMVLTSHDQLGNTGRKTGFWLEKFAAPYFVFRDAGVDLTLASPKGGQPPVDPKSDMPENQTAAMARFKKDPGAQEALSETAKLADLKAEDFDTVLYVGGHGPMWDLAESRDSINFARVLLQLWEADRLGVPLAWRAASRHVQWCATGEGKACLWLHQRGGRRSTADSRGAISRGG
ncbi:MAG TPA: type 1 glutamine amidotransferase domain-containing protein [Candidatus Acidoferrum sp.]